MLPPQPGALAPGTHGSIVCIENVDCVEMVVVQGDTYRPHLQHAKGIRVLSLSFEMVFRTSRM